MIAIMALPDLLKSVYSNDGTYKMSVFCVVCASQHYMLHLRSVPRSDAMLPPTDFPIGTRPFVFTHLELQWKATVPWSRVHAGGVC